MQTGEGSVRTRLVVFSLLFLASVAVACFITPLTIGPNLAGISHMMISFHCALPVAIGLFAFLNLRGKKKGVHRTLLPVLVFPLLFGLMFAYTMVYERNPQNMFRFFVADPIPVSVTDIQSSDISVGIDENIVVVFRASPEIINSIIVEKQLEKANDQSDGEYDFPGGYFAEPSYSWGTDWVFYERTVLKGEALDYFIQMWVDLERSIVIFRWAGG